jgi:hypothetical protein
MLSSCKIGSPSTHTASSKPRSVAAKAGATVTMVVTTVGLCLGAGATSASAAPVSPVNQAAVASMAAQLQGMLPQILAARTQTAAQNQAAAGRAAGAGCAGSFSSVSPVTVSGATASVNVHVDQALCDPLALSFVSYTKVAGKPYPMGPQNLFDKDTQTLQAAGVYTFAVNIEQGNGGVCASQIDLLKEANPPTHIAGLDLGGCSRLSLRATCSTSSARSSPSTRSAATSSTARSSTCRSTRIATPPRCSAQQRQITAAPPR